MLSVLWSSIGYFLTVWLSAGIWWYQVLWGVGRACLLGYCQRLSLLTIPPIYSFRIWRESVVVPVAAWKFPHWRIGETEKNAHFRFGRWLKGSGGGGGGGGGGLNGCGSRAFLNGYDTHSEAEHNIIVRLRHFIDHCSLCSLSGRSCKYCFTKKTNANPITLNPIWRFHRLNRQTNTQYLPMYILKNTRHPPPHNEFRKKVCNLGDRLSSKDSQGPPVVLTRPGCLWRCWQAVKKDGLSSVF